MHGLSALRALYFWCGVSEFLKVYISQSKGN